MSDGRKVTVGGREAFSPLSFIQASKLSVPSQGILELFFIRTRQKKENVTEIPAQEPNPTLGWISGIIPIF